MARYRRVVKTERAKPVKKHEQDWKQTRADRRALIAGAKRKGGERG
jgi:hypothetical protein